METGPIQTEDDMAIANDWRRWIAHALVAGADREMLVQALCDEGVPRGLAHREIDAIEAALPAVAESNRRMEQVLALLAAQAPAYIARRPLCGSEEFYDRYFSAFRPVVFADGCQHMAASSWTFDTLRRRCGDAIVHVGYPGALAVKLADAIDLMSKPDADPSFYMVSHNRALAGPLRELAGDLAPLPAFLHPRDAAATANLWLGPARTRTPLHHDTTSVYFCQLYGRKRYRLVAPWHVEVLRSPLRDSGDSDFDLDRPGDVRVLHVVLSPGESLFIPAGWWHEVTALDPSISISLRAYRWSANYDWYRPGRASEATQLDPALHGSGPGSHTR